MSLVICSASLGAKHPDTGRQQIHRSSEGEGEGALVAHLHQGPQAQLQHLLFISEVLDDVKDDEPWPVVLSSEVVCQPLVSSTNLSISHRKLYVSL